MTQKLIMAVPKGRILEELAPLLEKAGIVPEKSFFDKDSRSLRFSTNLPFLDVIKVRSFDAVTFVVHGAAALAVAGSDVLSEFDSDEIYAPLDLKIGACRLSLATKEALSDQTKFSELNHIRLATKYPKTTQQFFDEHGVQAESIKLNGSMELAPDIGLCDYIVDLVSTGNTLRANGLKEIHTIADVSSYLVVNRTSFKTQHAQINPLIAKLKEAING